MNETEKDSDFTQWLIDSAERQRERLAGARAAVEANDAQATQDALDQLRELSVDEAALLVSRAISFDASAALAVLGQNGALAAPVLLATRAQEPPLLAAAKAKAAQCMAVLMELGADPEQSKFDGAAPIFNEHPLDIALENGDAACARLLFPKCDMNRKGSFGVPPLMLAAHSPSAECFEAALAWDNPNKRRGPQGKTVLAALFNPALLNGLDDKELAQVDEATQKKLAALNPVLAAATWRIKAPAGGWAAHLASKAMPKTLEWLGRADRGFSSDANSAIEALTTVNNIHWDAIAIAASLRVLETFLPHASLHDEKKPPLPRLQEAIEKQINYVANMGGLGDQRLRWLWAAADCVAAFDPTQPGAESLWKLAEGDAAKLPRLSAAVEAQILRIAMDEAKPSNPATQAAGAPQQSADIPRRAARL